jgi:hypothetical protein
LRGNLSFEDGIIICKHIYQNAIDKTLNGVMEQEEILIRAHEMLNKINNDFNSERLDELLHLLNMENIYEII